METFGERLRELRTDKGLTQKELGEKIGYAQSTVVYWENNENEPTVTAIKKLCKFFGVSADFLIGLEDQFYKIYAAAQICAAALIFVHI